ncbi:uncharacterized protein LOC125369274 [Ricinus communis]|uniref:uncharacterized protein LOC125369274 n=1 Tax=Ricinus communis TaxID=3988 RepID=UPI00201AB9EF|nr:uncharacterized protein LOC125369274 [Ricinus communis]
MAQLENLMANNTIKFLTEGLQSCITVNGSNLQLFLNEYLKKHDLIHYEVFTAIQKSLNPRKLDKPARKEPKPETMEEEKYAKFLKEILSNKRKLEDLGLVTLNEECSAILQNKLPLKRRDPGSFTVPCIIGDLSISGALADLGASINLMPTSLFDKLGLSEPKPTRMSIQLADRTVKIPRGIIEDVLVKVDKFIFPIDFVVIDMEGESTVPLILSRPFLATSRAIIDVCGGKLQLRVDDETITFNLATIMRHFLDHDDAVFSINILDDFIESLLQEILLDDPLQVRSAKKVKSSFEDPLVLELKELDKHLSYRFMDEEEKLPVIIAAYLTLEERAKTLDALKRYKKAFAYKIVDIPGINPSLCSHKILKEDSYKPIVQPQRRLNPNMKEVVKKEVVLKKGGMTVIRNEQDELIPTRTVTGFRVCINYRRLNNATQKDHFPLPFIDQMLERLVGHMFYCFLDSFQGISISQLHLKTKRRRLSPTPTRYLLIDGCPLVYSMRRLRFSGV